MDSNIWHRDPHSGLPFRILPVNGYYCMVYQNNTQIPCRDQQGRYIPVTSPSAPTTTSWQQYPSLNQGASYTYTTLRNTNQTQVPPQQPTQQNLPGVAQYPGGAQSSSNQRPPYSGPTEANSVRVPSQPSPAVVAGARPGRRLDETYKTRRHPERFFVPGRVISVLWSEQAGPSANSHLSEISLNYLGGKVHSKIRRLVVFKEGHQSCLALSIHTYGGQGVAKPGVRKSDHGIIYTGSTVPRAKDNESPGSLTENPMRPLPIRIIPVDRAMKLDEMSRINFAKVYTVEHNWEVKEFGKVDATDLDGPLLEQLRNVFNGS